MKNMWAFSFSNANGINNLQNFQYLMHNKTISWHKLFFFFFFF